MFKILSTKQKFEDSKIAKKRSNVIILKTGSTACYFTHQIRKSQAIIQEVRELTAN